MPTEQQLRNLAEIVAADLDLDERSARRAAMGAYFEAGLLDEDQEGDPDDRWT